MVAACVARQYFGLERLLVLFDCFGNRYRGCLRRLLLDVDQIGAHDPCDRQQHCNKHRGEERHHPRKPEPAGGGSTRHSGGLRLDSFFH
jgi:hypothetical protein